MSKENLQDKTTEELEKQLRTTKTMTAFLSGILFVLLVACIYGLIRGEDRATYAALIVIPFALGGTIPLNLKSIKKIQAELTSRN